MRKRHVYRPLREKECCNQPEKHRRGNKVHDQTVDSKETIPHEENILPASHTKHGKMPTERESSTNLSEGFF